ncbi:MAG TPA: YCF48-related protein [Flavobacteriales bacterium]
MRFTLLLTLLCPLPASAQQWTQLVHPTIERCEDIHFLGPDTGWAAGGGSGRILRTYNGGDFWSVVLESDRYLRSIEFLDADHGFCGSLDGALYRTHDGGETWTDIMDELPQAVPGICGLARAGPQTVYGTGVFFGPAYVVKSTDAGATWQHIDLSDRAWCLIDVLFFDEQTGLACGGAYPDTTGASIFRTTDGGATWTEVFNTGSGHEWFWKLQSPDGVHLFASLEGTWGSAPRVARSSDAGLTWTMDPIAPLPARLQGVGFINAQEGWAGDEALFHSVDGGDTWTQTIGIPGFNRFQRVNDEMAFAGGFGIFRYAAEGTGLMDPRMKDPLESASVFPNPTSGPARAEVLVHARSWARIELRTTTGVLVQQWHNAPIAAGTHTFDVDLSGRPAGTYLFTLYTNLGMTTVPVVKR